MKEEDSLAVKLWKLVGILALIPISFFLSAYTVQSLWEWFVAATFNLPLLSIAQALGLSLIIGYLTKSTHYYVDKEGAHTSRLINSILKPLVVLGVGYLIHSYI